MDMTNYVAMISDYIFGRKDSLDEPTELGNAVAQDFKYGVSVDFLYTRKCY